MKASHLIIAAGLAALASSAQAAELSADTVVRPMTIAPAGTPLEDNRIIFAPDTMSLAQCQEAIQQMVAEQKPEDHGIIFACIPADLQTLPAGSPTYPMVQYSAE